MAVTLALVVLVPPPYMVEEVDVVTVEVLDAISAVE